MENNAQRLIKSFRTQFKFKCLLKIIILTIILRPTIAPCTCVSPSTLLDVNGTSVPTCTTSCSAACFKQFSGINVNTSGGLVMTVVCNPCITNCLSCLGPAHCSTCAAGYVVHPSNQCCTLTLSCTGFHASCTTCSCTDCTACSGGMTPIAVLGCILCTTYHSQCLTCNAVQCLTCNAGYIANSVNGCKLCTDYHASCLTCSALQCSTCATGYLVHPTRGCYRCIEYHASCLTCDTSQCLTCPVSYGNHPTSGCVLCTSYHLQCLTCNTNCLSCNTNYLVHPTSGCKSCPDYHAQCLTCDVTQCLTCSTGYGNSPATGCVLCTSLHLQCNACNSSCNSCNTGYLVHPTRGCYRCSEYHALCLNCDISQCLTCPVSYGNHPTSGCVQCTNYHLQCLTCNTICLTCNTGYFVHPIAGCKSCPEYHPQCLTCDVTQCLTCTTGYGIIPITSCVQCISYHTQCLTCTTSCLTCSTGYFIHPIQGCKSCPTYHLQCLTCNTVQCLSCSLGYGAHPTLGCIQCTTYHVQCTACNATSCITCNTGFFLHAVDVCKQCHDYHIECVTCDALQCLTCTHLFAAHSVLGCQPCNFAWDPQCLYCDAVACNQCITNSYLNFTTNNQSCDPCSYFKCTACIDGPQCIACQSKYFLQLITYECKPCYNPCKECYGVSWNCTACYNGTSLINNSCVLPGCISPVYLSGKFICLSCDILHNFAFINSTCKCDLGYQTIQPSGVMKQCQNKCGDGILTQPSQSCDDGNLIQNDGCYLCHTQNDFICSSASPSKCVLHINFYLFQYNYAYKIQGENKGILAYTIQPKHIGLKTMNWQKLMIFNISTMLKIDSLLYSYSADTGQLKIQFNYLKELQNQFLKTKVNFNPDFVVSDPSGYVMENKINGINAPLVFEQAEMLNAYQASYWVSQILIIFLMIQYFVGSYFHKMIGLQTLQVLQFFYFSKMIVSSKSTSILNSLNTLKVSCSGYSNVETFFSNSEVKGQLQQEKFITIDQSFLRADLQKYFLLNVNYFLAFLLISGIVYFVYLVRKIFIRNQYIQNKDNHTKDQYTILKRSTQWVYDHMLFPTTMMFGLVSFLNFILSLLSVSSHSITQDSSLNSIRSFSFSVQLFIAFIIFCIYCFQIFYSYQQYYFSGLSKDERDKLSSVVEKLQHDDNSPDKANYHPLYVLVYLTYILVMQMAMVGGVMIKSIHITIQIVLAASIIYFLILCFWKPYHKVVEIHNKILIFNQATLLSFVITCYIFQKTNKLSSSIYITMISFMLFFIGVVVLGGYFRIFIQRKFRKWLQENSKALQNQSDSKQNDFKKDKTKILTKKQKLFIQNDFLFQNQLVDLSKKYGMRQKEDQFIDLNLEQRQMIIKRSREQSKLRTLLNDKADYFPTNRKNICVNNIKSKDSKLENLLNEEQNKQGMKQRPFLNEQQRLQLLKYNMRKQFKYQI